MRFDEHYLKSEKSSYTIEWTNPDLGEEVGEYTENDFTKKYLKSNGIEFKTEKELLSFLELGKLVTITKDELMKKYENLTLSDKDFEDELKDSEYKKSFQSMEKTLENKKNIKLPSPIVLKINDTYYGFAGNRRMNLAFKYSIPLKVWLVEKESK